MADELPNDSAPEPEAEGTPQEPAGEAGEATGGEAASAEPEAAVAVLEPPGEEPEAIPDPTDAELALQEIREAAAQVDIAWEDLIQARAETKSAKEHEKECQARWEVSVTNQQKIIKGQDERFPLFDRRYFEAKNKIADAAKEASEAKAAGPAKADESWRSFPLANTTIPSTIVAILAESNYNTVGDIANLGKSGLPLTDIKGIGPAKADKIDAGLAEFWASHPEYSAAKTPPKAEADPEPDDEPREDREVAFEPPADEFDPASDSQSSGDDEEGQPEPDEEDLEGDDQHEDDDDSEE